MSTLIISQASASGAALLAACVRLWRETGQVADMHVICDKNWTLTEPFWRQTAGWLVGRRGRGPDVYRVVVGAEGYRLEKVPLPQAAPLILLRIPRDSRDPAGCLQGLRELVSHYGPLNVLEIADSPCEPVDGLRSCQLSHPPLLSLGGAPSPEVLDLARVFAASLYVNEPSAYGYLDNALSLTRRVRGDMRGVLEALLNHGIDVLRGGLGANCRPRQILREGDAVLFEVRLSAADAASLSPADTYLEHIVASVLRADATASWGLGYIPVGEQYKVVVAARYDSVSMQTTLRQRLEGFPSALRWKFAPQGRHYAMARLDARHFRQMLTAVLPAFFPAYDAALRSHALHERDRVLVAQCLERLEPGALLSSRRGAELQLTRTPPWTVVGRLSPSHPAVLAAACLLGPTHKQDRIRSFHAARGPLCRLWHILKSEPRLSEDRTSWRRFHAGLIEEFCRLWSDLWTTARLPLPEGDFAYAGRASDQADMATLYAESTRLLGGEPVGDAFFAALQRLYRSLSGGRGPGDEYFFALTPLLTAFSQASRSNQWVFGGYWDSTGETRRECLMWAPELLENVLRPFWDDLGKHAGPSGFLRVNGVRRDRWLEVSLLSSGPGVDSGHLGRQLVARRGLATAAAVVSSYGGQVKYRCVDGWYRYEEGVLVEDADVRPTRVRVGFAGVPELERSVAANPHLVAVDDDDRPDVVFTRTPVETVAGRDAPHVVISEVAEKWLASTVGFEVVYRLQRLG